MRSKCPEIPSTARKTRYAHGRFERLIILRLRAQTPVLPLTAYNEVECGAHLPFTRMVRDPFAHPEHLALRDLLGEAQIEMAGVDRRLRRTRVERR